MAKKYVIPEYISSRVYDLQNKFKTYISNEKTHEFLSWEGLSAKLWGLLLEIKPGESFSIEPLNSLPAEILDFVKENDIVENLNAFFNQIADLGLIVPECKDDNGECSILEKNTPETNKKIVDFQNEMRLALSPASSGGGIFTQLIY